MTNHPNFAHNQSAILSARSVAVIMTIKNDADAALETLRSVREQSRKPDEVIIVDGGSAEDAIRAIEQEILVDPATRFIRSPGANIARGRNVATDASTCEIIASIDAGCRAEPNWLQQLVRPFEEDGATEFVAGVYRIAPKTPFEQVVGLTTMRGQLEPFDPQRFNPSARSLAYSKSLWSRIGGWPEWLNFSEDTWFDERVRADGATWKFAGGAVVHWRPRTSLRSVARQFFHYGTGRGQTRIDERSFRYNLRNGLLLGAASIVAIFVPKLSAAALALLFYFHGWRFHRTAWRVARRVRRFKAYPLSLLILNVVMVSNTLGYLAGSWNARAQRASHGLRERCATVETVIGTKRIDAGERVEPKLPLRDNTSGLIPVSTR